LSQVLHSLCIPPFSPKESIGLFAAKSLQRGTAGLRCKQSTAEIFKHASPGLRQCLASSLSDLAVINNGGTLLGVNVTIPLAILVGAALIASAVYLKPTPGYQALYGDGYVYVVDLRMKNIANIIPGKTVRP